MQHYRQSFKMILFMSVLTGFIYPMIVLLVANLTMPWKAQGSIIINENKPIGSELIGQKFSDNRYFWGRPSAVNYSTLPSGASNLGPTSAKLHDEIQERRVKIAQAHNLQDLGSIPIELICASASGIDPHISLETAYFQLERIAQSRDMTSENMRFKIQEMIGTLSHLSIVRFFGVPHVNVLLLNLALDAFEEQLKKEESG